MNRITQTTDVLRVRTAATVLCLRRAANPQRTTLHLSDCWGPSGAASVDSATDSADDNRISAVFGEESSVDFTSGWELLMQQRVVKNWLRSTADSTTLMRYPGEFTFPGGAVDGGESIEAAARREVGEELGVAVPADARLRLLSVKQTRPINNTSNIMYNFVAVAEENAWLRAFDVEAANGRLARQRADLQQLLWPNDDDEDGASGGDGSGGAGRFWGLPLSERAVLAPEVQRVEWLDVCTAVRLSFTSMNPEPYTPVNDYQREEFRRHHRKRRDPMFLTMLIALEIETFPSLASIVRYTGRLNPEEELRTVQWLHDGMQPGEVRAVFEARTESGRGGTSTGNDLRGREDFVARRREHEAADRAHAQQPRL